MATVLVHADVAGGGVDPAALEVLARARELGDADAVVLGPGASEAVEALGEHGARRVFVSDDPVYADFVAQPAAFALERLLAEQGPEVVAFAATYDGRDIAGRLSARTGATLMSNVVALPSLDVARTAVFGGTHFVDVELRGTPRILLVRPKSFEPSPVGGRAEVVALDVEVPAELRRARRVERKEEDVAGTKLVDDPVVVADGVVIWDSFRYETVD